MSKCCCNFNPENFHSDCFQCGVHITKSDLTHGDRDQYTKILEKMENDCYVLCTKCAYKCIWKYYMVKMMTAMSKSQHYFGLYDNV